MNLREYFEQRMDESYKPEVSMAGGVASVKDASGKVVASFSRKKHGSSYSQMAQAHMSKLPSGGARKLTKKELAEMKVGTPEYDAYAKDVFKKGNAASKSLRKGNVEAHKKLLKKIAQRNAISDKSFGKDLKHGQKMGRRHVYIDPDDKEDWM
jgi:hypothetical protein